MNTNWTLVQSLIVSAFVISACTSYHEEEAPVSFGVNVNELSYGAGSSLCPVTVSSGTKWSVASMPSWMSLQSIKPSGVSPYEWTASFVAEANDGYNREGRILINAKSESAEIAVTQEGKKGKYVAVESVSLLRSSLVLPEGESYTMKYTISPWNASEMEVIWISSNPLVASVSAAGIITAVSIGTSRITVKTEDGGRTAVCDVTVKAKVIPVTGVSLDRTSLTMTEGESSTLTYIISPSNASEKGVTWKSSSPSVATVSEDGKVEAIAVGTTTITVTTADGGKTSSCAVTVKAKVIPVESVSLDKTSISMTVGDAQTLTATVAPENATDKSLTWSSSNTTVATVSSSGLVTAYSAGTATITVTTNDGSYTSSCSVAVVSPVSSIQLDKMEGSYYEGARIILNATIHPESEISRDIDWTSSDSEIADFIQFYSSGVKIRAKKEGNAIITASVGEKSALFYLSVKRSESYSIQYITDDKQIVSPKGMGEIVSNTYGQYGLIRFNQPIGDIVSYSFCSDNGSIDFYNLRYIKIPEGVTWISSYAFFEDYLVGISLPESLTNIGGFAFARCYIEHIIIPKNVVEIQYGALSHIHSLRSVIVEAEVPPSLQDTEELTGVQRIVVPDSSLNIYKSDPYWGKYSSIMYPRSESEAFVQEVKQNFERRIQGY